MGAHPPILRRTTIWVRNLEQSLSFYCEVVGLEVLERKEFSGPALTRLVGYDDGRLRIAHVGAPKATQGLIGLYELTRSTPDAEVLMPPPASRVAWGQTALVFECADIDAVLARVRAADCRLMREPGEYVVPPRAGAPALHLVEALVFDPDDVVVSLMGARAPVHDA